MSLINNLTTEQSNLASTFKRMLIGGTIALILIIIFLLDVGEPDPKWPKLWYIRPLIVVPFTGSLGGLFYHYMDHLRHRGGWRKTFALILSLVVYIIVLWAGSILGFEGTLWN